MDKDKGRIGRERERERERFIIFYIVVILFYCVIQKIINWDVKCIVKCDGMLDKVVFQVVKLQLLYHPRCLCSKYQHWGCINPPVAILATNKLKFIPIWVWVSFFFYTSCEQLVLIVHRL